MPDLKLAETVASRGHDVVVIAAPAPSAVRALLAGVLARREAAPAGLWLALTPAEAVDEWARVAAQVAGETGGRIAAAHTPARLTRLVRSERPNLLFTPPETAHELVRRAELKLGDLAGVLLLWPEAWGGDELASILLQDVAKESQRIVVTADPVGAAPLIERYCWRAPVTDLLGPEPADAPPPVRSMAVSWSGRPRALLDLVEQLDPESLAVSIADPADRGEIERALGAAGASATIGSDVPPKASVVVAYDLPSPTRLRELAAVGDLILLVPPGAEQYVARLAPGRRPLHARGSLNAAQAGLARARRTVVEALERGPAPAAYFAIAPLLERYEATAVAASLFELWDQARASGTPSAAPARPPAPSVQLWVGIGKRDAVTPHDLVAALIKDAGVSKEAVGKVEIRESFSLVQIAPEVDAEAVADKLTGRTIRKRRLVARVDRGRPARGGR